MMEGFNIDAIRNQAHDVSMPPTPQVVPQQAPIAYITQHYTQPTSYVAPQQYSETPVSDALAAAGVNASALLPSQIQLFRHAQPDQQARLIDLWRIAPPTYGNQLLAKHLGNWPSTSLEMEEEAAKFRYERAEQEKVKTLCAPQGPRGMAEPYMMNGYQTIAHINSLASPTIQERSHFSQQAAERDEKMAVDSNSREWWHVSDQPVEHQYGMLQQMQMQSLQLDSGDEEML
jgi:hypothetical protein